MVFCLDSAESAPMLSRALAKSLEAGCEFPAQSFSSIEMKVSGEGGDNDVVRIHSGRADLPLGPLALAPRRKERENFWHFHVLSRCSWVGWDTGRAHEGVAEGLAPKPPSKERRSTSNNTKRKKESQRTERASYGPAGTGRKKHRVAYALKRQVIRIGCARLVIGATCIKLAKRRLAPTEL